MSSRFRLVRADAHDVASLTDILLSAFASLPSMRAMWHSTAQNAVHTYYMNALHTDCDAPDQRIYKAIDPQTDRIAAYAQWQIVTTPASASTAVSVDKDVRHKDTPPADWPSTGNWRVRQWLSQQRQRWRDITVVGRPYIELGILATAPEFQRRGVGAQLLAKCLDEADELNVPVCLEATEAGLKLYDTHGFRTVFTLHGDMTPMMSLPVTGETSMPRYWMIRPA